MERLRGNQKILQRDPLIPIDGICVRIGAMRSHSQALAIKLKQDIPLLDRTALARRQCLIDVVENEKERRSRV